MDFSPPPNTKDFKDQKEYEITLKEWGEEFKKFSKKYTIEDYSVSFKKVKNG